MKAKKSRFPLFVDITKKKVLVVGGGNIALRRINTLIDFSFEIEVVAIKAKSELHILHQQGEIILHEREFINQDLHGAYMIICATDNTELNKSIGILAKQKGIIANIADNKNECDFYFPSIIHDSGVTVAVCGEGINHKDVKNTAAKIREIYHET